MSGAAARVQLAMLQPKLAPIIAAPFRLERDDLLHAKEIDISDRDINDGDIKPLCDAFAIGSWC